MRIRFNEISQAGNQFAVEGIEKFDDNDVVAFQEEVKSQFFLKRKGKGKVIMTGNLSAVPLIRCDRCLSSYAHPIKTEYQIIFEYGDESWKLKEIECTSSDLETVIVEEPVVDVDDILRQQILLQLPEKRICSMDCKGMCHTCGSALNESSCQCQPTEQLTPLAAAFMKLQKRK